jgi:hypothetical protein
LPYTKDELHFGLSLIIELLEMGTERSEPGREIPFEFLMIHEQFSPPTADESPVSGCNGVPTGDEGDQRFAVSAESGVMMAASWRY